MVLRRFDPFCHTFVLARKRQDATESARGVAENAWTCASCCWVVRQEQLVHDSAPAKIDDAINHAALDCLSLQHSISPFSHSMQQPLFFSIARQALEGCPATNCLRCCLYTPDRFESDSVASRAFLRRLSAGNQQSASAVEAGPLSCSASNWEGVLATAVTHQDPACAV